MVFRYSGQNWEGRYWRTAPAITTLGKQIELIRPESYPTDGTVASKAHDKASPTSDHRPDKTGVVRAIDAGGTHGFLTKLTNDLAAGRDPRLRYMIFNGRILRSYRKLFRRPWQWYRYTGKSPHKTHGHVSSVSTAVANNAEAWALPSFELEEEDVEVLKNGDRGHIVARMQKGINGWIATHAPNLEPLETDGVFGNTTEARVKDYQAGSLLPTYVPGVCGGITFGSLMEYAPDWIDSHTPPSSGGITQDEADARYATKPHQHEVVGETR